MAWEALCKMRLSFSRARVSFSLKFATTTNSATAMVDMVHFWEPVLLGTICPQSIDVVSRPNALCTLLNAQKVRRPDFGGAQTYRLLLVSRDDALLEVFESHTLWRLK